MRDENRIDRLKEDLRTVEEVIQNSLNGAAVMVSQYGASFSFDVEQIEVTQLESKGREYRYVVKASATF